MLRWVCATPAKSSSCSCWRSVLLVFRRTMPSPWARLRLMPPHGGYGILSGMGQWFFSINNSTKIIVLSNVGAAAYRSSAFHSTSAYSTAVLQYIRTEQHIIIMARATL